MKTHDILWQKNGGFTIIELLVVAVILTVLLALAIPAVDGFRSAPSLKSAAGQVMAASELARVRAIESGRPSFLVFSGGNAPSDVTRFSRFAVFVEEDGEDEHGDPVVVFNPAMTGWEKLPEGVVFSPGGSILDGLRTVMDAEPNPPHEFPFPGSAQDGAQRFVACPYVRFNSLGGIEFPSTPDLMNIVVARGAVSEGKIRYGERDKDGRPVRETIQLSRVTGLGRQLEQY